ncbi:hypothetical protein [Sinorhizobium medicae]|uniref:hypothetical protein n=1 Tax=Sinorhizobium medicae TaxID=110321 RepID=UPI000C7CA8C5|nr:hypothetical protein [Sinorhizobium medicae]MDX0426877.1 hypothetical protein [Sinorhizobium medicae]PLU02352.1 hypothetical protein BMJ32_13080 [Sinorhizobium medicae]PLU64510.1 hypothetical protein BMJ21_22845 [Sinorhizobium medicae]
MSKRTDSDLLKFFLAAAKIMETDSISVHVTGEVAAWRIAIDAFDKEYEWLNNSELTSIVIISIGGSRARIYIDRRPEQNKDDQFDRALFDALVFTVDASPTGNAPQLTSAQAMQINELIDEVFGRDINLSSAAFKDPKTLQSVLRSHQSIIERLQRMTLEVGEQTTRARRDLEAEYVELKKQLEDQVAAERTESQKAIDSERAILTQRADEVAARARVLDDRNNTHVRRELHEKLKARLADRFKKLDLTPETKRARWPIHLGVAASAALLAFLVYSLTSEALVVTSRADSTLAERILVIAKSATASLGFLGILSWYLRWMNRWFERLAENEFQLKQFELDITRAQWVVETAFEWKISQQSPIPDPLLENISRNLFINSEKDVNADMHPADYLASALIGKASNVKLAVPGAEIELGPKALNGAGKGA